MSESARASRFKPYPEYRDSGAEWLGEIPAGWEVRRLRRSCVFDPSKSELRGVPANTEVSFLPMEAIGENGELNLQETRRIEDVYQGYTYFRNGDVVVAKITPCFENGKGALCEGLINAVGFGTTELHVLRPKLDMVSRFIFYLSISPPFRELGRASMYGAAGQQRVSGDFVRNFQTPLPSLFEQRAIAAFLDRETARIDALVAKKERLVELLREKRSALISHAVTKGLDPTARMKDSGVEWLGEIPEGWDIFQLRRVIATFVDYRGRTPEKTQSGIRLVTARNIKNGRVDFSLSEEFILEEDYGAWMVRGLPDIGDVLVTTEAPLGEVAQIEDVSVALAQRIILLKADKERMLNDYLKYYLTSCWGSGEMWSRATGSTAIGIKAYHLKEIAVVVPPLRDQRAISDYLDRETARINVLVVKVQEAIERLKEYRTALISAAVTGKIDAKDALE